MDKPLRQPMYVDVADELCALVQSGQLKAGDRLPSVRRLVQQRGISATTAVAALRAMEHRGFATARPQSGYFAKARSGAAEPAVSRPSTAARSIGIDSVMIQVIDASRDPSIAGLGAATPDADLFPTRRLNRALAACARRLPRLLSEYGLDYPGAESLRRQLLLRYAEIDCPIDPQEIIITNGCTEALNLALRTVTRAGDTVAIESPMYYGMLQVLHDLGLKALEIASHPRDGMQIDALGSALRSSSGRAVKACLVSPNFSNPTGSCMSDADKQRLVETCAEHEVALIEDDIYGDLQHVGAQPRPAKAFDTTGHVILCSSFSKTLAPGARVGWLCGGKFTPSLRLKKFASSGASPAILHETLADILGSGGYERHLVKLRGKYAAYVEHVSAAVARSFPPGTRMTQPRGGFVIWIELPRGADTVALLPQALRHGVNFAPGPLFSPRGSFKNFLRLNCGRRWTPELDAAVARLGQLALEQRIHG
jgi:DNA-binding transcriptional MocR family regulator